MAKELLSQDVLDSLEDQIAVLDENGTIIFVNEAWQRFGRDNGLPAQFESIGTNYLSICFGARGAYSDEALPAAEGIRAVLERRMERFTLEYPCGSPMEQRWFLLRVMPLAHSHQGAIVSHVDITQRKASEEALRQRALEQALEKQSAEQRRRLGRELHDGLRQELVGIQMLSSSLYKKLKARADPEASMMQKFSALVADANMQVRQLINGLVPVSIDADSLQPALERAAANIEQWYGLPCRVSAQGTISLRDDKTVNHLFHIAQEAMTNAAKHSQASQIDVSLKLADETLTLTVRDDGIGLPESFDKRGGMGLTNLRHRAELIGAQLSFKSKSAAGTVVSCELPLA